MDGLRSNGPANGECFVERYWMYVWGRRILIRVIVLWKGGVGECWWWKMMKLIVSIVSIVSEVLLVIFGEYRRALGAVLTAGC